LYIHDHSLRTPCPPTRRSSDLSVTRGENAGHELRHAAVVRSMRKIGEAKPDRDVSFSSSDAAVSLRKEWNRDRLKAVAFVQEKKDRKSTRLNSSHGSNSYAVFC